ncbi:MAG: hypothetical protein H6Q52_666 [Deltaproteobacteria bacterium]|nr:hypothetical protein [Deltaproteobacteria bacterium]
MNGQVNEMEWESKQPLIELKAITKVYGKGQAALQALKGIDLSIHEGDQAGSIYSEVLISAIFHGTRGHFFGAITSDLSFRGSTC